MKAKWVFFDMGSTLVDENECYEVRFKETTKNTNIFYEEFVDKVLEMKMNNIYYPDKKTAEYFHLELAPFSSEHEKLFKEVNEVLEYLSKKKYKLGIIANQNKGLKERLKEFGILHYFDVVISSFESGISKPDKQIFLLALKKANCLPREAFMVGDRLDNDIIPAEEIKMNTILFRQGMYKDYVIPSEDKPTYVIDNLLDLKNIL